MRSILIFSFTFIISITSYSQYKISVSEKSVNFESGNHNAYTVTVYECSSKDVEKHWKKEMKDMKANVSSKKNEMKGDDAKIKDMGENTFDMYSANQFNWESQVELSEILEQKNKEGVHIIASNINDKDISKLFHKKNGWQHIELNRANVMSYDAKGKQYKEIIFKNF